MMALTSEEWAMLGLLILFFVAILYARANKKRRSRNVRDRIAKKIYKTAMDAQKIAVIGATSNEQKPILRGAGINERITPLDLQDPTRLYVRSTLAEMTHRDYLLENEFLNIDG
jgi:hypothetical protein